MKFSKELCGSKLEILIHTEWEFSDLIQKCFKIVEDFETTYSRFIVWNYLYELNKNKYAKIDTEFESIIKLCLKVSHITNGYYDITIQPILENAWYWIDQSKMIENIGYKNIVLEQGFITLNNWISIDLWSVWKGYIVDKIYNLLNKDLNNFSINFWWDIRVSRERKIQLEDPINNEKILWSILLNQQAIASSGWSKRTLIDGHHLFDAKSKKSQNDKLIVYVTHNLAVFADIFATALYVTPIKESLDILASIPGLEAMIIDDKWKIYKSRWFKYNI
jgi:thiamine biosynthesis lipoprotein